VLWEALHSKVVFVAACGCDSPQKLLDSGHCSAAAAAALVPCHLFEIHTIVEKLSRP
jgi:hypothetical protein